MSDEETHQKRHDESESEESDDDGVEDVPKIDIDPSTLTALSPEVISKQVRPLSRPSIRPGSSNSFFELS